MFYGNVMWQPTATGNDSAGKPIDFHQPVFSEDWDVLDGLKGANRDILLIETLFGAAQAAGMATAAVGKSGAEYLQDARCGGLLLDEKTALPIDLARKLQAAHIALPPTAPNAYASGELVLGPDNGNPVEFKPTQKLKDGVTTEHMDGADLAAPARRSRIRRRIRPTNAGFQIQATLIRGCTASCVTVRSRCAARSCLPRPCSTC